jgi:hypothetical protein
MCLKVPIDNFNYPNEAQDGVPGRKCRPGAKMEIPGEENGGNDVE